jgi:hypothetical protein
MTTRTDDIRRQVNGLWKQATLHLDDVKKQGDALLGVARKQAAIQLDAAKKQATHQLDAAKKVLLENTDRFDDELRWLKTERDRLLRRLGEQTHRLAVSGKLPLPAFVRSTVDRLDEVLSRLVDKPARKTARRKPAAKKAPRKKAPVRKTRPVTNVN